MSDCIFDPFSGALDAFELDPSSRSYRKRTPDAQGRYASRATALALGVVPTHFGSIDAPLPRWIRPDGAPLPTSAEAVAEAEERIARGEQRAEDALRRVAELEARLRGE